MVFFQWKDSFKIGIDKIDQQHRTFLELLNDCCQQFSSGKKAEAIPGIIDNLKKYADTHFRFEESLMRDKGYPELNKHEELHKYFESQIAEFKSSYDSGIDGSIDEGVFSFLRDWFLKHILEEDKGYVPYVKE